MEGERNTEFSPQLGSVISRTPGLALLLMNTEMFWNILVNTSMNEERAVKVPSLESLFAN